MATSIGVDMSSASTTPSYRKRFCNPPLDTTVINLNLRIRLSPTNPIAERIRHWRFQTLPFRMTPASMRFNRVCNQAK
eukprot:4938316-Amphidinium_carterae.1